MVLFAKTFPEKNLSQRWSSWTGLVIWFHLVKVHASNSLVTCENWTCHQNDIKETDFLSAKTDWELQCQNIREIQLFWTSEDLSLWFSRGIWRENGGFCRFADDVNVWHVPCCQCPCFDTSGYMMPVQYSDKGALASHIHTRYKCKDY